MNSTISKVAVLALALGSMAATTAMAQTVDSCKEELRQVRIEVAKSCMSSEDQDKTLEDLIDAGSMCNTSNFDGAAELLAGIREKLGIE